jgi:acyl-CoA thioesterase-1
VEDEVVPIINRVADEMQVPVIDVFSATRNKQHMFSDGVHPNADGYRIIAETVAEAIIQ